MMRNIFDRSRTAGDRSKQGQTLWVKMKKCIGFNLCRRPYLLWSPVIVEKIPGRRNFELFVQCCCGCSTTVITASYLFGHVVHVSPIHRASYWIYAVYCGTREFMLCYGVSWLVWNKRQYIGDIPEHPRVLAAFGSLEVSARFAFGQRVVHARSMLAVSARFSLSYIQRWNYVQLALVCFLFESGQRSICGFGSRSIGVLFAIRFASGEQSVNVRKKSVNARITVG